MRRALLICLCASLACCSGQKKEAVRKRPAVPVRTLHLERTTFVRALSLTGEVFAPRSITLSANVEGSIACCAWREGDTVTEAQDVFSIDRTLYQREVDIARQGYYVAAARDADLRAGYRPEELARFEQEILWAKEQLEVSQKDRDRTKKLYEGGSVSREVLEKAELAYVAARTRLDNAENQMKMGREGATRTQKAVSQAAELEAHAKLELARSKFAETRITAPFAGTFTKVYARPGDNAAPRTPLVELADLSLLVVRFSVPESQSASIRLKQKVTVQFDAHPGRELTGEINRIHPTLDSKSRVLWVEAKIFEDVRLIPGMFARIRLILDEIPSQIVVPEMSLITRDNEHFVFTVEDQKAKRKTVKVGLVAGGWAQILSGLEPGSLVIMENANQFRDGQDVEVLKAPPTSAGGGEEKPRGDAPGAKPGPPNPGKN